MTIDPALDLLPTSEVVDSLLRAEQRVLPAVRRALPAIVGGAELIADRMRGGGRLVLLGAGTSGRLAVLQAAELPGTFGLAQATVVGRCAGAGPGGLTGTDRDEDDTGAGRRDLDATGLAAGGVMVAVAASGSTPYTLAAAARAKELGAAVISVTTVADTTLAAMADVAIEVFVGPEVLKGSTRLGAGTAQKLVLDALTTAAMARLGRVHGNVMIDVVPANIKLRERSAGLVAEISGHDVAHAREALARCDWNARAAVLHLVAGLSPEQAADRAAEHASLRDALGSVRVNGVEMP